MVENGWGMCANRKRRSVQAPSCNRGVKRIDQSVKWIDWGVDWIDWGVNTMD